MKLKQLVEEKSSQKEIAKELGISPQTFSNYVNEKTDPDIKTLINLADYFNVSLDYLVDRQWSNDLGHTTKEQLDLFKMIKQLSISNFYMVQGFVLRLLQEQVN